LITSISAYVPAVLERHILADNYLEFYEGNGKDKLLLRERPILLVSSINWRGQSITNQCGSDDLRRIRHLERWPECMPDPAIAFRAASRSGSLIRPAISLFRRISASLSPSLSPKLMRAAHMSARHRAHRMARRQSAFDPKAMHASIADKLSNYQAAARHAEGCCRAHRRASGARADSAGCDRICLAESPRSDIEASASYCFR
jgi:hypothetical protein